MAYVDGRPGLPRQPPWGSEVPGLHLRTCWRPRTDRLPLVRTERAEGQVVAAIGALAPLNEPSEELHEPAVLALGGKQLTVQRPAWPERVSEGAAAVAPGPISTSWWLAKVANRRKAPAAKAASSHPARTSTGTPVASIFCRAVRRAWLPPSRARPGGHR